MIRAGRSSSVRVAYSVLVKQVPDVRVQVQGE
jgi:hypothetical protein